MVGKTNANASQVAYAYIKVEYSPGSSCSATNGSKTMNAPDTSGTYVFCIPEPSATPDNWTVNVSSGGTSNSETVSISQRYQIETVSLLA